MVAGTGDRHSYVHKFIMKNSLSAWSTPPEIISLAFFVQRIGIYTWSYGLGTFLAFDRDRDTLFLVIVNGLLFLIVLKFSLFKY